MQHLIRFGLAAVLVRCPLLYGLASTQSATELLAQAEKLADAGNRYRARPLFAKAEEQFRAAGDTQKELYAKFGRLHAESEQGKYQSVKA